VEDELQLILEEGEGFSENFGIKGKRLKRTVDMLGIIYRQKSFSIGEFAGKYSVTTRVIESDTDFLLFV